MNHLQYYKKNSGLEHRLDNEDHRLYFDKLSQFNNEKDARTFAFENLPSVLIHRISGEVHSSNEKLYNKNKPFVVAVKTQTGNSKTVYGASRCKSSDVEKISAHFMNEIFADKIIAGSDYKIAGYNL